MELYFMISSFCFKSSTPFLRGKLGRTIVWVIIISLIAINITWCKNYYRRLECKSRKSRNTWSNRQTWPWNTEWSRAKTNRVLPRKCTGHSKHPLPTTQEKTLHMKITRWSTPNQIMFFAAKDEEALYRQQQQQQKDQKLTVAQIMNSLLPNSDLNWRK